MPSNSNEISTKSIGPIKARRIFVEGQVQHVFFREWSVSKAREMGMSGWVRNRSDGRVEVYAIGDSVLLDRFEDQLRKGSPASKVNSIRSETAVVETVNGFSRRQTA